MNIITSLKKYVMMSAVSLTLMLGLAAPLATSSVAIADSRSQICAGIGETGGNCSGANGGNQLQHTVKFVVQLLSWIVGIAGIIMIIVAGIKYTTSGGDPSSVTSAKRTLIYALIGLVVASLAQFIVHYVIGSV